MEILLDFLFQPGHTWGNYKKGENLSQIRTIKGYFSNFIGAKKWVYSEHFDPGLEKTYSRPRDYAH